MGMTPNYYIMNGLRNLSCHEVATVDVLFIFVGEEMLTTKRQSIEIVYQTDPSSFPKQHHLDHRINDASWLVPDSAWGVWPKVLRKSVWYPNSLENPPNLDGLEAPFPTFSPVLGPEEIVVVPRSAVSRGTFFRPDRAIACLLCWELGVPDAPTISAFEMKGMGSVLFNTGPRLSKIDVDPC